MVNLVEWGISLIISTIVTVSYPGIIGLMALESACVPIPSEIVMPFGGYLSYTGELNFWLVVLAGTVGCLLGSLLAYYVGAMLGRPFILKYGKYLLLSPKSLERIEIFFERRGELTVFVGRLLPVVRTFISLPAGISKMNVKKFSVYTFFGSLPWCLVLTYIGYWLGDVMGSNPGLLFSKFHGLDILIIVCAIIFIAWYLWHIKKETSIEK